MEFSFLPISHVLLLACLLAAAAAAAKPGRSTLDTKKGYKTKIGSTSSVTLALTRIEYWDRAGGGRNIVSTTNEVRNGKWMRASQTGLKMSGIHPFGHHKWTRIIFGKPRF